MLSMRKLPVTAYIYDPGAICIITCQYMSGLICNAICINSVIVQYLLNTGQSVLTACCLLSTGNSHNDGSII